MCGREGQTEKHNKNEPQNHQDGKAQKNNFPCREPGNIAQDEIVPDRQEDDGTGRRRNEIRAGIENAADAGRNQRTVDSRSTENDTGCNGDDNGREAHFPDESTGVGLLLPFHAEKNFIQGEEPAPKSIWKSA